MADTWRHTCNLGESLVYVLDRVANERNARHLRPLRFLVVSSTRKDTASKRINIVPTAFQPLLFNAFRTASRCSRWEERRDCIKLVQVYDTRVHDTFFSKRHEGKSEILLITDFYVTNQFSTRNEAKCFEVRAPKGYWMHVEVNWGALERFRGSKRVSKRVEAFQSESKRFEVSRNESKAKGF